MAINDAKILEKGGDPVKNLENIPERVINAFLTGNTIAQISENAGISPRTVSRYRADKDFQNLLRERKSELMRGAIASMQANMGEAVEELMRIIRSPKTPANIKVSAIQVLLSQCRSWTESNENIERLDRIEAELREYDKFNYKGVS
ncbi:MAG: hypothetical protein ACI4CC_08655 [Lachnospiraceae bacterium]